MNVPSISSILLVGTENPVALPIIRAIGTVYPEIDICTLSRKTGALHCSDYSRFVGSNYTLQSYEGEALLDELLYYIKKCNPTMLWPVDEHYTREVSAYKETLESVVMLPPLASTEALDLVCSKERLAGLLVSFKLDTPATFHLAGQGGRQFCDKYPACLIKPVKGTSGRGIKKICNKDTLEALLASIDGAGYILQEFIPGQDIDCSLLAVNGRIKAYTIQRGLSKVGYSFSTALILEHNMQVLEYVEKFIDLIKYNGIAHLDFRLDNRDSLIKLIDFNARFWFTMEASKAAGIDFAKLYCLETLKMNYPQPVFEDSIYLLGKSVFKQFLQSVKHLNPKRLPIYTDLKTRLADPMPELVKLTG